MKQIIFAAALLFVAAGCTPKNPNQGIVRNCVSHCTDLCKPCSNPDCPPYTCVKCGCLTCPHNPCPCCGNPEYKPVSKKK